MKHWGGWAFPDGEEHLVEWMKNRGDIRHGRATYQAHKLEAAMLHTKMRRRALDIGANIGTWSWLMAREFKRLDSFEPVASYADCWRENVTAENATLHEIALGAAAGTVEMICVTDASCGDTTVAAGQFGRSVGVGIEMRTVDSFGFLDVDLIKADNEGYEFFVMQGAEQTIKRCRPTVIVEQKPGHGATFGLSDTAAFELLQSWGMRFVREIGGDFILDWAPQ